MSAAAYLALLPLLLVPQVPDRPVPPGLQVAVALADGIDAEGPATTLMTVMETGLELVAVDARMDDVAAYLETHPGDLVARVLQVRLARIRDLVLFRDGYDAAFQDVQQGLPEPPSYDRHLAALDDVLAQDSTVADAYFWAARLLMEDLGHQIIAREETGLDPAFNAEVVRRALGYARGAVRFDPSRDAPRILLAPLLVSACEFEEAEEVLREGPARGSFLHRLVADVLAFAPPSPTVVDEPLARILQSTQLMAAGASPDPYLAGFLDVRVLGWSTSASLDQVEAHYRGRWPELEFRAADGLEGVLVALFVPEGDGWRPVLSEEEYRRMDRWDAEKATLVLFPPDAYREIRSVAWPRGPALEDSEPRVGIAVMNGRHPWD